MNCIFPLVVLSSVIISSLAEAKNIPVGSASNQDSSIIAKSCAAPLPCTCQNYTVNCRGKSLGAVPPFTSDNSYKRLDLGNNDIYELHGLTFYVLRALRELNLNNNHIRLMNEDTFGALNQIRILDLGYNELQYVQKSVFLEISTLINLNLEHNQLHFLSGSSFSSLYDLQVLNLANNQLITFDAAVLIRLHKLQSLFLQQNPDMMDFPFEVLSKMPDLERIQLTGNIMFSCDTLTKLGDVVTGSDRPSHCDSHSPSTTSGPNSTINSQLSTMFTSCPAPKPCMCDVGAVNCHQKNLKSVPLFRRDGSITHLDLSNNQIYEIGDRAFANFPNLEELNLAWNHLRQISTFGLFGINKLLKLDLSANAFQYVSPGIIQQQPALTEFNFHSNQVTDISGIFDVSDKLENINLANNDLQVLKYFTIRPLVSLTNLYLNNNPRIKDFTVIVLPDLPKFVYINLEKNDEFSCESLSILRDYLQSMDAPEKCRETHTTPSQSTTSSPFGPAPTVSEKCGNPEHISQVQCLPINSPQNSCVNAGCCYINLGFLSFCFSPN